MLTRPQALELLHGHMQNQNLRRHCYAVEAVMTALAKYFKADHEKWGTVGLLHDGDYEETKSNPSEHTLKMVEWLKDAGESDEEVINAILSHNYSHTGQNPPNTPMEWALYCCDELTGLIVAVALVRPDKQLVSVTVESVQKKWNDKTFAVGVDRKQIEQCEEKLGIPLPKFIGIALSTMQKRHKDFGL